MNTVAENMPLKGYNTFGINSIARYFAPFSDADQLVTLIEFGRARALGDPLILGGGSNLLFTHDVNGIVLLNEISGTQLVKEDEKHVYVKVGAGERWHSFVEFCLQRNWAGVENLALIPGSIGAAPMQNIGAYGVELKEVFHELDAWSLDDEKVYSFTLNDCQFGYRESVFKKELKGRVIILNVTFRLDKNPHFRTEYGSIKDELEKLGVGNEDLSIQAIARAIINIRSSKLPDPDIIGNAGSFFKNPTVPFQKYQALQKHFPGIVGYAATGSTAAAGPIKLAAGWLIEQCGWKGFRRGDAGCHERQALVLVNYNNATGKEIFDLSEEIVQSVQSKFGVEMEREVNII